MTIILKFSSKLHSLKNKQQGMPTKMGAILEEVGMEELGYG